MVAITCPHCHKSESVVKYGFTQAGSTRCRCKDCKRAFTLNPRPRTLTPEKEALVLRCLEERTSIRGVCRTAEVSPNTVYAILKKRPGNSPP